MTSCFLLGKDVSVELFQNVNIENRNYTSATTHMTITVTCYWLESHLMRTMVIIAPIQRLVADNDVAYHRLPVVRNHALFCQP